MAAKKAPAKKAAPVKKASAKPRSSGGSRDYDVQAEGRANEYRGLTAARSKAGQDARNRASKYGTIVGPTRVSGLVEKRTRGGSTLDDLVFSKTQVKVPGGILSIREEKLQRWGAKDGKPKTTISGVVNKKRQAGDLGAQRAAQRAKYKAQRAKNKNK
jgi:hypothetical protein